jgi:hypothetical protein
LKNIPIYTTKQTHKSENRIQFLFESVGNKKIIKAIEYSEITKIDHRPIFNLGFGDYDELTNSIRDDINTNNGDVYCVFNTVLNTIPNFFNLFPDAVIFIRGSDSSDDFFTICKATYIKKCTNACEKMHRRIKLYTYFLDKNFDWIFDEFMVYGRSNMSGENFVAYLPKQSYEELLFFKKK